MPNIIVLTARDYAEDKASIENAIKGDPWVLLDNDDVTLDQYLTNLHDTHELKNKTLSRLKICRFLTWNRGDVTLIMGSQSHEPANMNELLALLEPGTKSSLIIEREKDGRKLLANIAQQLIYLSYPLAEIDLKLRREFKDAERVRRFMQKTDELAQLADEATRNIQAIKIPDNCANIQELEEQKKAALECYHGLKDQIAKAKNVEMKVAVAASKKTGKSVLVNSMLRQELAPTSLEMATPNSCVYRKSHDDHYHLIWDKEDPLFSQAGGQYRDMGFDNPQDVHRQIDVEFKQAQKNRDQNFRIPDMTIEYVSDGGNFESYTIHDTPGPDAAGTDHGISAEKAMQNCDASIFAIDYSKYLTDTEAEYLKTVKSIFEEKHKFHTLLFTINKIDMALQDSGAKSRVKSVDFIRNRLIDIDKNYEECIIFATSSLDFFNTVTLEQACANNPLLAELMLEDANWCADLAPVLSDLEDSAGEDIITALTNLAAETMRMQTLLGYKHINLKDFRDFTGMPQMLSYLQYVLQSKAREEIVNNIAVQIDTQTAQLKAIIDKSANLAQLLDRNQEEIAKIKRILETYRTEVDTILNPAITEEDLDVISDSTYLLPLMKDREGRIRPGQTFDTVLERARISMSNLADVDKAKKELWQLYSFHQRKAINRQGVRDEFVDRNRLGLSNAELNSILEQGLRNLQNDGVGRELHKLDSLGADLQKILAMRFHKINRAAMDCREKLAKENCELDLPRMPVFDITLTAPAPPRPNINSVHLANIMTTRARDMDLVDKVFLNFKKHGLDLPNFELFNNMVSLKDLDNKRLEEMIDATHKEFHDMLDQGGINDELQKMSFSLGKHSIEAQEKLISNFHALNETCKHTVDIFMQVIDDRERYEGESAQARVFLNVLNEIEAASSGFMQVWNDIKNPEISMGAEEC